MSARKKLAAFIFCVIFFICGLGATSSAHADESLNTLFAQLAHSTDASEAASVRERIEASFKRSGSDSIDLIMTRAQSALEKKDDAFALQMFDAVVELAPSFAQGWASRAELKMRMSDKDGALVDANEALNLEPRHLQTLLLRARLLKAKGENAQTARTLKNLLALDPRHGEAAKLLKTLPSAP